MSGPVDVLAVMELAATALNSPMNLRSSELVDRRDALRAARTAVAELIEAAALFEREVRRKYADDAATGHASLRAALNNVGPQS